LHSLVLQYFLIYLILISMAVVIFSLFNLKSSNQWVFSHSRVEFLIFWTQIVSLAGLPPFLGFSLKWLILSVFTDFWSLPVFLIILLFRFNLFFYLNIFLVSTFSLNFSKFSKTPKLILSLFFINILGIVFLIFFI